MRAEVLCPERGTKPIRSLSFPPRVCSADSALPRSGTLSLTLPAFLTRLLTSRAPRPLTLRRPASGAQTVMTMCVPWSLWETSTIAQPLSVIFVLCAIRAPLCAMIVVGAEQAPAAQAPVGGEGRVRADREADLDARDRHVGEAFERRGGYARARYVGVADQHDLDPVAAQDEVEIGKRAAAV